MFDITINGKELIFYKTSIDEMIEILRKLRLKNKYVSTNCDTHLIAKGNCSECKLYFQYKDSVGIFDFITNKYCVELLKLCSVKENSDNNICEYNFYNEELVKQIHKLIDIAIRELSDKDVFGIKTLILLI